MRRSQYAWRAPRWGPDSDSPLALVAPNAEARYCETRRLNVLLKLCMMSAVMKSCSLFSVSRSPDRALEQ
jgi:hypothetical protein